MAYGRVNVTGFSKTKERKYLRLIANQAAVLDVYDRTVGATDVFYDLIDGTNDYSKGHLDTTATRATQALAIGTTVLTNKVESTTGFAVGQEVTVQDDTNKETVLVTKANATELEVAALSNAYKKNASIYRSNAVVDTTNKTMKIGSYINQTIYDHTTPVQVVNHPYETKGNGGRKLIKLADDTLISLVIESGTTLRIYKSLDNGNSWSQLCFCNAGYSNNALVADGNIFHFIGIPGISPSIYSWTIDYKTQSNINLSTDNGQLLDTQTIIGDCSLAINADETKICGAWTSKNATYPDSFNIRAIQGTISGGVVTWGSVEQVTFNDSTEVDIVEPCVVYASIDGPRIFGMHRQSSLNNELDVYYKPDASWSQKQVFDGTGRTQSNPSATFIPASVATKINTSYTSGLIVVAWDGKQLPHGTTYNICCKASSDNGANWFDFGINGNFITEGDSINNYKPSITHNLEGEIFITWYSYGSFSNIELIKHANGTWGSPENLTGNTSGYEYYNPSLCDNYHDFEKPLAIWQDLENSRISFYGKWTAGQNIPLLSSDVRYNITPESPSNEIVSWIEHEADAGFTVDAQLSVQNDGENEAYSTMTKSTTVVDDTHEDEFVGAAAAKKNKATVKLTLTRNNTGIDKSITKVLGAIGE